MNILLLSQFLSQSRGGGEYVFSSIASSLADCDHKVWIICHKIKGESETLNHKNIKFVYVQPDIKYQGGLPPSFQENIRYTINAFFKGIKVIKKEKIDLIHSNNFSPSLAGSTLSIFSGKPHITTVHDVFSLYGEDFWKKWASQNNVSKLNSFLAPFFEKLMMRFHYDAIHTVSEATRDDLIKVGAKKPIYVIPNSLKISNKMFTLKKKNHQIVYVGRLVFYKNLEVVISAIKLAKKQIPDIKLQIVGDGPHRKVLEDLVKKLDLESNVEFCGYKTIDEKNQIIDTSSALVLPSLFEGFGIVILEAFQASIPALVSDLRPMSDIVEDGVDGYTVNPKDEKSWAEYIITLMKNPKLVETMGKNGNEKLKLKYNSELMRESLLTVYKKTMNQAYA